MRDPNPGFKSDSGIFNGYKLWVTAPGTLYPEPCTCFILNHLTAQVLFFRTFAIQIKIT